MQGNAIYGACNSMKRLKVLNEMEKCSSTNWLKTFLRQPKEGDKNNSIVWWQSISRLESAADTNKIHKFHSNSVKWRPIFVFTWTWANANVKTARKKAQIERKNPELLIACNKNGESDQKQAQFPFD